MAGGWHYIKLSLSSVFLLSFFWDMLCVIIVPFFLSFSFCFCFVSMLSLEFCRCPLIFSCRTNHVPDRQPRILLGMVEARSVNVKNTTQQ